MTQAFGFSSPLTVVIPLLTCTFTAQSSVRAQTVDCVNPAKLHVSRILGQVFDPSGNPIPSANIEVRNGEQQFKHANADASGNFDVKLPFGEYSLEVSYRPFQSLNVEADVGQDLRTIARPTSLYVILGLAGSFCSWVTTSKKEFHHEVRANKKRIEEAAQRYATHN